MEIKLKRTIWPVGHGAFYTEQFFDETNNPIWTTVYDCGCYQYGRGGCLNIINSNVDDFKKEVTSHIDILFISHFDADHVNGLQYLMRNMTVDYVVIPELVASDFLGNILHNIFASIISFKELDDNPEEKMNTIRPILRWFNDIQNDELGETHIIRVANDENGDPEPITPESNFTILENIPRNTHKLPGKGLQLAIDLKSPWIYIPVHTHSDAHRGHELVKKLEELRQNLLPNLGNLISNGKIDFNVLMSLICSASLKDIRAIYYGIFGERYPNAYSMPVYSGLKDASMVGNRYPFKYAPSLYRWFFDNPIIGEKDFVNCLYMGDFEATDNKKYSYLRSRLSWYWPFIRLQQIPHHASFKNHNINLYEYNGKICFANVFSHKDISMDIKTIRDIVIHNNCIRLITEQSETKLIFIYFLA